jgi:hypothetical protein
LGTDCHDCGTTTTANFTTWDDDGWWDDDDNYWDIDDKFEYADARGEHGGGKGKGGNANAGSLFVAVLEGMVYLVGAVLCGGGAYFAAQAYKGEGGVLAQYRLAPTMDPDFEMAGSNSGGRASNVPITPDVSYTN